ncbi:hypothetical protein BH23GEM7_BH23GEM7_11400 [soil metagenome]|jgi:hypothetical protein
MTALRSALIACVASSALLTTPPLAAQDVQYETLTRIELPGALGTAMRVAARLGGGSTSIVETTYIKGKRMRTDVDQTSTIFDLEGRRFIQLEHGPKTYFTMTFDELAARAKQTAEEIKAAPNQRRESGQSGAETQLDFRFSVDEANQRERVAGYNAERFFLTMEAEGEFTPEGTTEREKGGTLVILTDMWTSKDMPAFTALNTFHEATAREYANASAAMMEGLAAAFAEDPRMRVGFDQSIEQIRKMDGMPMKTTINFVAVAPDQKFDRQLALGESRGPSAAQQAGRSALRGIAARAAGAAARQQDAAPAAGQEQTQATILKVTSEIRNVRAQSLDAKLFEIPAGYQEARAGSPE